MALSQSKTHLFIQSRYYDMQLVFMPFSGWINGCFIFSFVVDAEQVIVNYVTTSKTHFSMFLWVNHAFDKFSRKTTIYEVAFRNRLESTCSIIWLKLICFQFHDYYNVSLKFCPWLLLWHRFELAFIITRLAPFFSLDRSRYFLTFRFHVLFNRKWVKEIHTHL